MNKKIPLGIVLGLICLAAALSGVIATNVVSKQYNSILKGLPGKVERYSTVEEIEKIIAANFFGSKTDSDLQKAIARGYINSLDDGKSRYLTADEYASYLSETKGDVSGIGIEFVKNKSSFIEIAEVYDGSPAKEAGLKKKDIIIAFDGIMINSENYKSMVEKLTGDKLSRVNLTFRRNKKDTTVNISKGYEAKSVFDSVYGGVGYIKITNFFASTADAVKTVVDKFTASGVQALVLDLRKNSSDNYDAAMDTLDVFVPMNDSSSPAASVVGTNGQIIKQYATTAGEINLPCAVLISENTANAAELFCLNMKDFSKAELVGTETAGSGLVSEIFKLSDGDAVLLSVGEAKPYRSETYNSKPINPGLVSELKKSGSKIENDSQFLDAVNLISPNSEK